MKKYKNVIIIFLVIFACLISIGILVGRDFVAIQSEKIESGTSVEKPDFSEKPIGGDGSEKEETFEQEENLIFALNGIGYIIQNPFPNYKINFEIENNKIVTVEKHIGENSVIVTPISVGQTKLVFSATDESNTKVKIYNIKVSSWDDEISLLIEGEENGLKSGMKADGTYSIYDAYIESCRILSLKDFQINFSDNIKIVENTLEIKQLENKSVIYFSFYILHGEKASFNILILNDFANQTEPTIINKEFNVVEFVSNIDYTLYDSNNIEIEKTNNLILYCPITGFEENMNEEGYATFYKIVFDKSIYNLEMATLNTLRIIEIEEGFILVAENVGVTNARIKAKDGSGNFLIINFEVKLIKPSSFTVNLDNTIYELSKEEFIKCFTNLSNLEFDLNSGIKTIQISKNPIFSSCNFEIIKTDGSSINLNFVNENGKYIYNFIPEKEGETYFKVIFEGEVISNFKINVVKNASRIIIFESTDTENLEITDSTFKTTGNKIVLYLRIIIDNVIIQNVVFDVSCANINAVFDKHTYGRVYVEFKEKGEYLFTFTNLEYNLSKKLKIIVE